VRAHLLLGWAFSTSPLLHGQELGNQHLNKAYRRPKGSLNALASTSQALSAPLGCHIPSLFFWPDWPDVYSCAHSPLAKLLLCIEPAPHSFISTVAPSGLRSLPLPSSTPLPLPTAVTPLLAGSTTIRSCFFFPQRRLCPPPTPPLSWFKVRPPSRPL
jgi:hypothetical protein